MAKKKKTKEDEAVKKAVDKVGVRDPIQSTYAEGDIPLGAAVYTADEVDALTTLTEASGFTKWVFTDGLLEVAQGHTATQFTKFFIEEDAPGEYALYLGENQAEAYVSTGEFSQDGLSFVLTDQTTEPYVFLSPSHIAATRKQLSGYQLGSQSSKLLQPAGDYALKSEIPDVPTLPLSTANGGTGVNGSSQAINKVLASPASGSAGAISFRSLVEADIPNLSTEKLNAGTLGVARGGTGKSSHTVNSILAGNASSATGSVQNIATANGALYATSANGAASFGTLPIAQGGTGATTASGALTNLGALSTDGGTINGTLTVTGDLDNNGGFIETMGVTVRDYATGYVGTDSDFLLHIKTMPDTSEQLPMGDVVIPRRTGTVALSSDIAITELPLSDWTVTTTTSSTQWSELYLVAGTTGWVPYGRLMDTCGDPKGDENSTSLSWTEGSDAAFNITATRSAGADWSITPSNVVLVFDNGMWFPKTIVEMPIGMEKGTADSTRIEWDSNEANIDILAVREPARYILGPDSADNPNRGKPFAKVGDYALKSELPDVADPSDSSPLRDGTASAGTMKTYARGDHRHPTDTTRIARAGDTSLTGNFKTTGTVTAGSLIAIGDVIVGEPTAYSNMAFAREGIISLKNDSATTLLAIPGGQQASDTNNTMPVLATTDHVPNKVKSQNGATFIQPNNDGTATILYIDPNATYGPPVITFSNDFSYGTMSSYAGTTVTMEGPYTVETAWTAWVKAGESAPTTISDLMSRDFVVANPNSTAGFMFFNEGVDFASIQHFESQSPTVIFYNSGVGSATMTRSISGGVAKTIATIDELPEVPIKAVKQNGTVLTPDSNGAVNIEVSGGDTGSYSLTTPEQTTSTTTTTNDTITVQLSDHAINAVSVPTTATNVVMKFPQQETGKARDFFVRLIVTGETVPSITLTEPDGSAVEFDVNDDSWAEIEQGVNLLMFTETAQ